MRNLQEVAFFNKLNFATGLDERVFGGEKCHERIFWGKVKKCKCSFFVRGLNKSLNVIWTIIVLSRYYYRKAVFSI